MDVEAIARSIELYAEWLGLRVWTRVAASDASRYLHIQLPSGREVTVRVSDHATVSHRHPATTWNVAPGRDALPVVLKALSVQVNNA